QTSTGSSYPSYLTTFGDDMFFLGSDTVDGKQSIFKIDSAGVVSKAVSPPSDFYCANLIAAGSILYFTTYSGTGYQIWATNGTPGSAVFLANLGWYGPGYFASSGNRLFFNA